MTFNPRFRYTNQSVKNVGVIEAARAVIDVLPLPPDSSLRLRHDAFERSTRSSTAIEGNQLDREAVRRALAASPRKGSDAEQEVRNYWRALDYIEDFAEAREPITEEFIRKLHRIVIVRGAGRRGSLSDYRTQECPVVDQATGRIDYGPPEPKDVPALMQEFGAWLSSADAVALPPPVRAGILTHRFISIHPFPDGNGRTGRLLATAELWRSGYRMRGFFSFDEYFNEDRPRYYESLQMGLPVDYYQGRHNPDHTPWLEYFIDTLAKAAGKLHSKALQLHTLREVPPTPWDALSRREQQVITRLFNRALSEPSPSLEIRTLDIQEWFGVSDRTAREWLIAWTDDHFVEAVQAGAGQRIHRYRLAEFWHQIIQIAEANREK